MAKIKSDTTVFSASSLKKTEFLPTGIIGIDALLGGGVPKSGVIEIFGQNQLGKTLLSLTLCRAVQESGRAAAFIDGESALTLEYLELANVDPDELEVKRPISLNDAIDYIIKTIQDPDKNVGIIVLDSVAVLKTQVNIDKFEADAGAAVMAREAMIWSNLAGTLMHLCSAYECTLVLLNQVRTNISGYGATEVCPGGKAIPFMCGIRLRLSGSPKFDEDVAGIEELEEAPKITYTVVKNKLSHTKGRACDVHIGKYGINKYTSMIFLGKALGLITGAAWCTVSEEIAGREIKWQGIKGGYRFLSDPTNQDVYDKLYTKIMQLSVSRREPKDVEVEIQEEAVLTFESNINLNLI